MASEAKGYDPLLRARSTERVVAIRPRVLIHITDTMAEHGPITSTSTLLEFAIPAPITR